ncbi:hypothetical protein [Halomontanus rarus]|uniref:hypothetical protein n=1 Tax=Halomontanus rarus TaxID=3034020 RepID=UPI001A989625
MSDEVDASEASTKLRPEDRAVLEAVADGANDVHALTQQLSLSHRKINYAVEKLERYELLAVERPDGWTEKVVDGQRRKFRTPKRVRLTQRGKTVVDTIEDESERFQDLDHTELVKRVRKNEQQIEQLKAGFANFRRQVLEQVNTQEE